MTDSCLKVSVVIPIYNTARYLPECLESVMNQTLKEIEIICVNDGSTDDSPRILAEYALKDERIKIIHKENGGLVAARKTGVLAAKGTYVAFVDSDDWIEPDMYEQLFRIAEENKVAMVTCGFYLEGNYTTTHMDTVSQGVFEGQDMFELRDKAIYNLEKCSSGLKASLCYKLFKKELIQKSQCKIPDEITMAEDKMCLLTVLLDCSSVYVYHRPFYHYRIRPNSMVNSGSEEYLLKVYAVYKYLRGLYDDVLFTENMRKQSEIYITELLYKGINTLLGFKNKNLLWVDPYWLDKIPADAKIILCGAGELGKKYRKQLQSRPDLRYITCIDFSYERLNNEEFVVESPDVTAAYEYDYIVITVKNPQKAQEIRTDLEKLGIVTDKILWFDQTEFFWKFARADGLLNDQVE
ncbi:MAG: glycosyltransferase [Lachnospiraceae bacterium]|nr:glycosyltransferase [Lachnospiraceae bacterium]